MTCETCRDTGKVLRVWEVRQGVGRGELADCPDCS